MILSLAFLLLIGGCSRKNGDLEKFQNFVQKFEKNNREIAEKSEKINLLFKEVLEKYPDSLSVLLGVVDTSLTDEELELLEKMIQKEQDTSLKTQLQMILSLQKELDKAKEELNSLRRVLPLPIIVKKGQTHYKICLDYLMENQGLSRAEAIEKIEQVGLFEPLVEKFYVWNYYHDGVFGSFVTQGEAPVSPMQVYRKSREQARRKIEEALIKRDSALYIANQLKILRSNLEEQLGATKMSLSEARKKIDSIKTVQKNLELKINSLKYYIDTEKSLVSSGYLHQGFLRKTKIKNFPDAEMFSSLDLRYNNTIVLEAANFGMKSFKKVIIYPKSFKNGVDYKLTYDKEKTLVSVILKKPAKFRQKKILIGIE